MDLTKFDVGDWAAFYAAIVATGALFLEVRRWFESRAKLSISTMPEAKFANKLGPDDKAYIIVNVSNRGGAATTITHLAFCAYKNWWKQLRGHAAQTFVVPDPTPPGSPQRVPYLLQPGGVWTGMAEHDEEVKKLVHEGNLWVQVIASHNSEPTYARVRKPTPPPKGKKLD